MRGHNEGSIYRRGKDGCWVAEVTLPSGRRRTMMAKTRAAVVAKLSDFKLQQSQGVAALDGAQTVEQFLAQWLESVARHTVRPSTFESYESLIRVRVLPELARVRLGRLTAQQLQALYSKLLGNGLSPASVRRTHAVLHRAFEQAVKWNIIMRNPADGATPPRLEAQEMAVLSVPEVLALVDAAPDQTMRTLFALAATGGLRRGELLGLRWSDIDMAQGRLTVARTAQRITGKGVVYGEPKTRAGRREVPLFSLAKAELRKLQEWQAEVRAKVGSEWNPCDVVFASAVGTPVEETRVTNTFKAACRKAGIANVRVHDLRHTAATVMLESGLSPRVAQEYLGHANVAITLGIYGHVTPGMHAAAVAAVDAAYATDR